MLYMTCWFSDAVISGREIGPFRAVEESTVAHLTTAGDRSDIYAWYSLLGNAGTAFGMITCGRVIHHLDEDLGWQLVDAYRMVFYGYAALGVVKITLALMLSGAVELEKPAAEEQPAPASTSNSEETAPLLAGETAESDTPERDTAPKAANSRGRALLSGISRESVRVMVSLCLLFALDSFASGLAPL